MGSKQAKCLTSLQRFRLRDWLKQASLAEYDTYAVIATKASSVLGFACTPHHIKAGVKELGLDYSPKVYGGGGPTAILFSRVDDLDKRIADLEKKIGELLD